MDSESPQSRELGCWDGPAATSGFVKLGADMSPQNEFEPGQDYYDFLMEIGYGKDLDTSLRSFWEETIKNTYQGDEGKRRICMAAINLASRDGLYARLPYVKCPVLWLHVSSPNKRDFQKLTMTRELRTWSSVWPMHRKASSIL